MTEQERHYSEKQAAWKNRKEIANQDMTLPDEINFKDGFDFSWEARDKEIAELKARIGGLEEALRFYADVDTWYNDEHVTGNEPFLDDMGMKAQKALE